MEKKLRRKCVQCDKVYDVIAMDEYNKSAGNVWHYRSNPSGENLVMWQTDPFEEEIRGNMERMWLCLKCEHDSAWEI